MRKIALGLALAIVLSAAAASAQTGAGAVSTPLLEIAGGYSLVRTSTVVSNSFNLQGGSIALAGNVNHWLGFVGDFGYYSTKFIPPTGFKLNVASYTFGPRISFYHRHRLTLFAHDLLGVGHAGGSLYTAGFSSGTAPPSATYAFAMLAGGGVDVTISRRWAIRAFQVDWLYTTFPNGARNRQQNLRLTFGAVFLLH